MTAETLGRRIVVVGVTGSGKTTLARALASRLGRPHIEMDAIHWQLGGWRPLEKVEFRRQVAAVIAPDYWVADGNYTAVRPLLWRRADTLIWLDYPLWVNFWRLMRRTLWRWATQENLWGSGNYEKLYTHFFTHESLFWWAWITYRRHRLSCLYLPSLPPYQHLHLIRLRSPQATARWLNGIAGNDALPLEVGCRALSP